MFISRKTKLAEAEYKGFKAGYSFVKPWKEKYTTLQKQYKLMIERENTMCEKKEYEKTVIDCRCDNKTSITKKQSVHVKTPWKNFIVEESTLANPNGWTGGKVLVFSYYNMSLDIPLCVLQELIDAFKED